MVDLQIGWMLENESSFSNCHSLRVCVFRLPFQSKLGGNDRHERKNKKGRV
jgi:hypothetical protein